MKGLPRWVKDDAASVHEEAAPYRGLSAAERLHLTAMACRAAARQLMHRPDRAHLLDYRDPLPTSSVELLARLRAAYRAKH